MPEASTQLPDAERLLDIQVHLYDEAGNEINPLTQPAGVYYAKATTYNTNYYLANATIRYYINKIILETPGVLNELVYSGEAQQAYLPVSEHYDYFAVPGFVSAYSGKVFNKDLITESVSASDLMFTNVGTYYVYALVNNPNYEWRDYRDSLFRQEYYEIKIVLTKKAIYVTLPEDDVEYTVNGVITINITDDMILGLLGDDVFTGKIELHADTAREYTNTELRNSLVYSINGQNEDHTGDYNVYVVNSINVIYPPLSKFIVVDNVEVTYDGNEHGLEFKYVESAESIVAYVDQISGMTISYTDSSSLNDWTEEPITYTESGNYTVWYKLEGEKFSPVISSRTIKINKADYDLVISADDRVAYSGNPIAVVFEYDQELEFSVKYTNLDGKYPDLTTPPTEVGRWEIVASLKAADDNHNPTTVRKTVEITPIKLSIVATTTSPYMGAVGNYKAEVDQATNLLAGHVVSFEYGINSNCKTYTYNSADYYDEETETYATDENGNLVGGGITIYLDTVKVKDVDNDRYVTENYDVSIQMLVATIEKTDAVVKAVGEKDGNVYKPLDREYNGKPISEVNITTSSTVPVTENDYHWEYNDQAINYDPVDAGTYYLVVNVTGDANTNDTIARIKVVISQLTLDLRQSYYQRLYDGTSSMPTVEAINYEGTIAYNYELIDASNCVNVGSYRFRVSIEENTNYKIDEQLSTFIFTVNPTSLVIRHTEYQHPYAFDTPWTKNIADLTIEGLAENDTISGTISTNDFNVGTYVRDNQFLKNNFNIVNSITGESSLTNQNYLIRYNISVRILYPGVGFIVQDANDELTDLETNTYYIEVEYDGLMHYATVIPTVSSANITYSNGTNTQSASFGMTDAGTMTISFALNAPNYITTRGTIVFTIKPAKLTINVTDTTNLIKQYDQRPVSVEFNVTPITTVEASVKYYRAGYNYQISAPSAAGAYKVVITVPSTKNYEGDEKTIDFAISQSYAKVSIGVDYKEQIYTGEFAGDPKVYTYTADESQFSYKYFNYVEDYTVADYLEHLEDELTGENRPYNVGKYVVLVTVAESNLYLETTAMFTYTISKRIVNIMWYLSEDSTAPVDSISYIYNGMINAPKAYFISNGQRVEVTVTVENNSIHAGNYNVVATYPQNENLQLTNDTKVMHITQKTLQASLDTEVRYDGNTHVLETLVDGLAENDSAHVFVVVPAAPGVYRNRNDFAIDSSTTIIHTFDDESTVSVVDDYIINLRDMKVEVAKDPIEYTTDCGTNETYMSKPLKIVNYIEGVGQTVNFTIISENATITYSENNKTYREEAPTFIKAGTYAIYFKIEGEQYKTVTDRVYIRILPTGYDFEFNYEEGKTNYDKVYDGYRLVPSVTIHNFSGNPYVKYDYYLFDEETGTYSTTRQANAVNAGKYKIEATIAGNKDYSKTTITDYFTISKAQSSLIISDSSVVKNSDGLPILTKTFDGTPIRINYEQYGAGQLITTYSKLVGSEYEVIGGTHWVVTGYSNIAGEIIEVEDLEHNMPVYELQAYGIVPTNCGTYKVHYLIEESANYKSYEVDYDIRIANTTIYIGKIYGPTEYTEAGYTGSVIEFNSNTLSVLVKTNGSFVVSDDTFRLTGSVLSKNYLQGTYVDSSDFEFAPGYKIEQLQGSTWVDVTDSVLVEFVLKLNITKAVNQTVTVENTEVFYDASYHGITINGLETVEGAAYNVFYSLDNLTFAEKEITYKDAGEYTVYYRIVFDNFQDMKGSRKIIIKQTTVETLEIGDANYIYNGEQIADPEVITESDGEIVYQYVDMATNQMVAGKPIYAGDYTVRVRILESNNFKATTVIEKDLHIAQKEIRVKWTQTTQTYSGNELAPKANVIDGTIDQLVLTVTPIDEPAIAVATYPFKVTADNPNYLITNDTTTLEVTKLEIEVPTETLVFTYSGNTFTPVNNEYYESVIQNFKNANVEIDEDGNIVGEGEQIQIRLIDDFNTVWKLSDGTTTTDNQYVTLIIKPMCLSDEAVVITPISDQNYTKSEVTPDIVMTLNGKQLQKHEDFAVTYENNINPYSQATGASLAVVRGFGNYYGTVTISFKIMSTVITIDKSSGTTAQFVKYDQSRNKYTVQASHTSYSSSAKIFITNIHSSTTLSKFLTYLAENQRSLIQIYDANGGLITRSRYDSVYLGTGFRIQLRDNDGNILDSVYVSIRGDLNGDGVLNTTDLTKLRSYLSSGGSIGKKSTIEYLFKYAADINSDNVVNSTDMNKLQLHFYGSPSNDIEAKIV